jgi:myo-inositol-1(or 4)-monophosphatase
MLARAGTIAAVAGFQGMAEAVRTKPEAAIAAGELPEIEQLAVELARLAGAEIVNALGGLLTIRYKTAATDDELWRDPVSEVDHNVEKLIRARLAERFPAHDVIGEEMDDRPGRDHDVVWAVDPIDGTANFINGFPMFAASIGVLHRGRPVAGALWCSASHALRSGVYHARRGGRLRFDGEDVTPKINPAVRTGLAGLPDIQRSDASWDSRKTGSAAIECALTAAGILRVARFNAPNIWDVAGGLALVQAAGGEVRQRDEDAWRPFERFVPEATAAGAADLRFWRHPLVIGRPEAVERMCGAAPASKAPALGR